MFNLQSTTEARLKQDGLLVNNLRGRALVADRLSLFVHALAGHLPMVLVLCAGGFLRLHEINAVGFNSDEAVYAGQAAALAHDPELSRFFPVIRAHPMLFQSLLGIVYQFGVSDLVGRLLSVAFGLGTIVLVYRIGYVLYGRRAGQIAALIIALMPYHVLVSRQVLLDGPMTFFATLTLYLLVEFSASERPVLLYATGAAIGLVFLSKETGFILITAIYAFLALTPEIKLRIRDIVIALAVTGTTIATFPISVYFSGRSDKAQSYVVWQIFRRPNHTWSFYPEVVPPAVGWLVLLAAVAGLLLLRRQHGWKERLLICWVLVPVTAFELWPVKGFQYLLPAAPAVAVLAGRTLALWRPLDDPRARRLQTAMPAVQAGMVAVVAVSLLIPSWHRIQPPTSATFLAGSGGLPGGRETGAWIRDNVPQDALFLTVGPSMANVIQFYGHRKAYGLSVSPNPLHRNPSYEAINNPDNKIRNSELQYLVYDSFSAARSPFFGQKLLKYAETYNGRIVYQVMTNAVAEDGSVVQVPLIVIYEVRP